MRILLLEGDPDLSVMVCRALRNRGLTVDEVKCLAEVSRLLLESPQSYACLILDRVMSGDDALNVVGEQRARGSAVPIIILSGRNGGPKERIHAFEVGADDCVDKPYDVDELAFRVLSLCRKAAHSRPPQLRVGDVMLDSARRRVFAGQRLVELTHKEFAILETLISRPGEVVSRAELWDRCWGDREVTISNALDVHLGSLRQKIGIRDLIRTVRGSGYSLGSPTQ